MAKNVFVLGAGASREAGAPLMYDFIDKAEELFRKDLSSGDLKRVFQAISDLQVVHSKSYLDLDNIEVLFGAIEMATLINRLSDYTQEDIVALRSSLINVIVLTLESSIKFPVQNGSVLAPKPYDKFADLLKKIPDSSVITFNYDISMDYALYRASNSINYCLDNQQKNGFKLLKLHGSTNWGKCGNVNCNKIMPLHFQQYFRSYHFSFFEEVSYINFGLSNRLHMLIHEECNNMVAAPTPVLVPPTWNKTEYHGDLANVWSQAAQELAEAVNIFVIGYSLPETDSFFRYLYALGTAGPTRMNRFWLFDPDPNDNVSKRYANLIGKGIDRRFKHFRSTFSEAVPIIEREILSDRERSY